MQIRNQLAANARAMTLVNVDGRPVDGMDWAGYTGKHTRIRFKSRARNHGNKVGQSGRKQG